MESEPKPVILDLRIDWSEMDLFGHVNNVSFFKYVQAARVNYWREIGLYTHHLETKEGPMLASCKCDFRKALHFPGEIRIETIMEFLGKSSFGLYHRIFDSGGECCAEARDVIVTYDYEKMGKTPFPAFLKEAAEKVQGGPIARKS